MSINLDGVITLVEKDAAIRIPSELIAPDGRRFCITAWEPRVAVGECISAKVQLIYMPPQEADGGP